MLEPHLCFYCSQPSHDHCEGSSRCSRDPAELGDELACRLLTRSALEHILPWEMLSWNNSLLFSNNTVLIFGGHTQQRDLSVAQGQRLFIPPDTLGALFSKSPILNWKNGPQDEFGAAACTRRADCILLSGLKGARGGQPLKLDQTANSGAGRAVCFICPQSSQPFIIQRTLRNYQCAFNNTRDWIYSAPTQVSRRSCVWNMSNAVQRQHCAHTQAQTHFPSLEADHLGVDLCTSSSISFGPDISRIQNNWTSWKAHVVLIFNNDVTDQGNRKAWWLLTANSITLVPRWGLQGLSRVSPLEPHAAGLAKLICYGKINILCFLSGETCPFFSRLISEPLRQHKGGNCCGVNKSRSISGAVMCF